MSSGTRALQLRHLLVLALSLTCALLIACGGDNDLTDGGDTGGGLSDGGGAAASGSNGDPCSLATAEMVAAAFGGSSSEGEPGLARNCEFVLTGGVTDRVNVFHFGSSTYWEGVRDGFVENRDDAEDIEGVGDEALLFPDLGAEILVHAGDVIFGIVDSNGNREAVTALARAIADAQ